MKSSRCSPLTVAVGPLLLVAATSAVGCAPSAPSAPSAPKPAVAARPAASAEPKTPEARRQEPAPPPLRWTLHGDGAEPRAPLRYRHGSGAFSCVVTTENHTELTAFVRRQDVTSRLVIDVRRDVEAGRFVATLSSYAPTGGLFQPEVYQVAGAPSMTFDVGPRGEIGQMAFGPYAPLTRNTPGVVALEKARQQEKPLDLRELDRLLGPVRRQMEQVLRSSVEAIWTPLPEMPVGRGASWTLTKEWSSSGGNPGSSKQNLVQRTYILKSADETGANATVVLEQTTSSTADETGPEATGASKSKGTGRTILRLGTATDRPSWTAAADYELRETGESRGTVTYEGLEGEKTTKSFEGTTRSLVRTVCK